VAQFGKCPDCGQLALLAVTKRNLVGDLVAFLKCVNCDYEGQKTVASFMDLDSPRQYMKRLEDPLGLDEDDDDQ
jgi:hypothetical protein